MLGGGAGENMSIFCPLMIALKVCDCVLFCMSKTMIDNRLTAVR